MKQLDIREIIRDDIIVADKLHDVILNASTDTIDGIIRVLLENVETLQKSDITYATSLSYVKKSELLTFSDYQAGIRYIEEDHQTLDLPHNYHLETRFHLAFCYLQAGDHLTALHIMEDIEQLSLEFGCELDSSYNYLVFRALIE